jgi:hypothetical protein
MVPSVQHLCSQLQPPNQESGPNESVQHLGPIQKDSHRCSRFLPVDHPRKPIHSDHCGLFCQVPEAYAIPNQEALTVVEVLVTSFFCHFRVCWSYIVARAVTSSPVWYRRFCNVWEWVRHAPRPSNRSQMAWWNTSSKWSKSTYEMSSHRTRGIETQDYTSSSLITGHPLTTLWAWPWLALCSEENSNCLATCCLGHPATKNDPQLITWQI